MNKEFDPTAFKIMFDPRTERMSGTAIHGDTPFDVPFISHVKDNLWQGGCEYGLDLPAEFDHLISLYPWEKYTLTRPLITNKAFEQYDDDGYTAKEELFDIAHFVHQRTLSGTTLVHCQAGLNRSGRIAALVLMIDGLTADEAITLLREKRSPAVLCNQSFESWLRQVDLEELRNHAGSEPVGLGHAA